MICAIFWSIAFLLAAGLSALAYKFRASLWPLFGAPIGFLICGVALPHPERNIGAAIVYFIGLVATRPLWERWIIPCPDPRQELFDAIKSTRGITVGRIVVVGDTSGRVIPTKEEMERLN